MHKYNESAICFNSIFTCLCIIHFHLRIINIHKCSFLQRRYFLIQILTELMITLEQNVPNLTHKIVISKLPFGSQDRDIGVILRDSQKCQYNSQIFVTVKYPSKTY